MLHLITGRATGTLACISGPGIAGSTDLIPSSQVRSGILRRTIKPALLDRFKGNGFSPVLHPFYLGETPHHDSFPGEQLLYPSRRAIEKVGMVKKNYQKKKYRPEAREVIPGKAQATGSFAEASSGKDGRTAEKPAVSRGAFEQEATKKGRKRPRDVRAEGGKMPGASPPGRKAERRAKKPSKTLSVAKPVVTSEPRTTAGTPSCTSKAAEYETVHDAEDSPPVRKKRMNRSGRSSSQSLSAAVDSQSSDGAAASLISEVRGEDDGGDEGNEAHATLEGILHDGTIYLVDDSKRVFSSTRDARGSLVQVGKLSGADGTIAFSRGFDVERVSTTVESGSIGAPGDANGGEDSAPEKDGADKGTAVASGVTGSDTLKARKRRARKKARKKRATGDASATVSGANEADAGVEALCGEQRDAGQEGGGPKGTVQTVAYPFEVDVSSGACTRLVRPASLRRERPFVMRAGGTALLVVSPACGVVEFRAGPR